MNKTIELRQLRSFLAVAQEMNFTRAALTLHIAQPPLSRQIRELEDALGTRLFERTTRSMSLTAAGTAFLAETQKLFQQLEYTVQAAHRAARGQQGDLRLGYTGRASQSLLPALLRKFHATYPDVSTHIDGPHPSGYLREKLLAGHVDVALCFLPVAGAALRSLQLMRTPLAIALPTTHALAARRAVQIQDLRTESFVSRVLFTQRHGGTVPTRWVQPQGRQANGCFPDLAVPGRRRDRRGDYPRRNAASADRRRGIQATERQGKYSGAWRGLDGKQPESGVTQPA